MENDEKAFGQTELESATDTEAPENSGTEIVEQGPTEVVEQEPTDEELFLAALNGDVPVGDDYNELMFAPIKRGQIIKGTIASKTESEILIDVGVKSEGIITGREFEKIDHETKNSLRVGETVNVYVLAPEGPGGHVQLSLHRALEEQDWEEAEELQQKTTSYESKVTGYNKGGLIVRVGKLRGFVPASQISRERQSRASGATPEERWSQMVGDEIIVKVIEVDRGRNRLILSERAAAKEWRAKRRAELLESLEVGQVHTGRVISLADFGAFVDLGGADGLVHLSELSWEHVANPKEVLKVGDEVQVEIINIDREHQRIGLSRRKCLADPWDTIVTVYKPGQLVQATITKMTKFGVFARLVDRPEVEGLIHISELSDRRIGHPREVVEEGQVLTLRVIRIESERRRIALSLKQVTSEEYADADWRDVLEAESSRSEAVAAAVTPEAAAEEAPAEAAAPEPDVEEMPAEAAPVEAVAEAAPAEAAVVEAIAEEAPAEAAPVKKARAKTPRAKKEKLVKEVVAEAAPVEAVAEQASQEGEAS